MSLHVRDISQRYWRSEWLPHFELRSTFRSTQPYKAHSHSALSVGVIVSGQTRLTLKNRDQVVQKGDVVLIEPGQVHACNPVDGHQRSYHMLYIDTPWCLQKLSRLYASPVQRFTCDQTLVRKSVLYESALKLVEQLENPHVSGAELAFDHLAFEVLYNWCSHGTSEHERFGIAHRLRRRLLDDLVHPPPLEKLAEEFGLSRETIIRLFKKQHGTTPKSFINNARIEQSKLYLKEGMPIADTSLAVGFSDQSQFHRAFVAYTASTPRQYQQAKSIFDNNS